MLNAGVDLGLVAILVSMVAVGFAGYQAWIGARQTRIQRAAAELSFNLEVITRLGDVQLAIADRPDAHTHVWAGPSSARPEQDYRPGHVLTLNLIDALELAMQATQRLPGFTVNRTGWGLYALEVFDLSAAVRQEVTEHPEWWPTVSGHLRANRSVPGSHPSVESPDPER
jgi:predicted DNA-binding protein with PD1-like motif